jgi:raffinose/stachyose/melibiose transport system substrate-binding protein
MESTFNLQSFDCYGASILASTTRVYYNEALMREITGRNRPPRSLEEMLALCARVREFARRTGRPVMPFAGSWANGPDMLDDYFRTQTQRLGSRLDPGTFDPVGRGDFLLAYLNHEWSLDSPEILRAFDIMSAVGDALPAGFDLSDRDIAFSCFDQGRALMLSAYSQDATGVLRYANFPVGVFRDPAPASAGFTAGMVARNSEHALIPYGAFTITRASPHPAEALDFLRFITSQREDRKFSALADTLPVVVGVSAAGFMRNFIPDPGGFPPGPALAETGDVRMLIFQNWYRLFGPGADRAAFLAALSRDLPGAARRDLRRALDGAFQSIASNDAYVEAARRLSLADSPGGAADLKYQSIVETQNDQEANAYYQALRLRQSARFQ